MYAAIRASGKKNRLRMKKPKKLWPLRPARSAGQKARLTQMTRKPIARIHQPSVDVATTFTMSVPPWDSGKGQTRTDPGSRESPKRDDSRARDATVARQRSLLARRCSVVMVAEAAGRLHSAVRGVPRDSSAPGWSPRA